MKDGIEHTPGPWEVEPLRKGAPWHLIRPVSDPEQWVAQVPDPDSANARLIAAAPVMLEALERLLRVCTWVELTEVGKEAVAQAEAAIAKTKE